MSLHPSGFQPPQWLRSPHLQSILSSSPLRARRARLRLHAERARHTPMVLEVGDGVRLQGVHSAPANGVPHALRAIKRVNIANLAKVPEGKTRFDANGKIMKPEGWKAPDITEFFGDPFDDSRQ